MSTVQRTANLLSEVNVTLLNRSAWQVNVLAQINRFRNATNNAQVSVVKWFLAQVFANANQFQTSQKFVTQHVKRKCLKLLLEMMGRCKLKIQSLERLHKLTLQQFRATLETSSAKQQPLQLIVARFKQWVWLMTVLSRMSSNLIKQFWMRQIFQTILSTQVLLSEPKNLKHKVVFSRLWNNQQYPDLRILLCALKLVTLCSLMLCLKLSIILFSIKTVFWIRTQISSTRVPSLT